MGTILVSEIFERTGRLLHDEGATRWTAAEMLDWYNEGLLDAVTRRPALLPSVDTFVCVAGCLQVVPADRISIISVGRNLGPAAAPKSGPIPLTMDKTAMDRLHPTWMSDPPKHTVAVVIGQPGLTHQFYTYPQQPSTSQGRLEITFSKRPTVVTLTTAAFEPADEYMPIIIEYLLWRAMSKDGENPQLTTLAAQHLQNYLGLLGAGAPQPQQG